MIKDVIDRIRMELADSVNVLNEWFLSGATLMNYQPADKVWSVSQNLEHIILTNHYLLILIKKGTAKALEKAVTGSYTYLQTGYDLDWGRLASIGRNKSFEWNRPEHMEPTGMVSVI